MDTTARRRRAHVSITSSTNHEVYTEDLSMYTEWPQMNIHLAEFEQLALERLDLLRILEQASLKGHKYFSDDWKQCIKEDLLQKGFKKFVRLINGLGGQSDLDVQARRADDLSHFILRMAYCRSEDLRKWFLAREMDWFKLKYVAQSTEAIERFLAKNDLNYVVISDEAKHELQEELVCSTANMTEALFETSKFYKVKFQDILPLVKNRRVFLKGGFGYVPTSELVVCIQSKFRAMLSESLAIINHNLPQLDDDRLTNLLSTLHSSYTGPEYIDGANKDAVNPADLDAYSKKHFPLCMQHLHENLRADHHLKHQGRLVYGLFLKAIGVQYENFVEFWRQEFTKKMDNEKFNKDYLYTFKHMFGKAGKMVSYSPYGCMKIITSSVGQGECHGCPFKHSDISNLKAKFNELGLSYDGAQEILKLVNNGHYQIACTKYFQLTHSNKQPTNTINHPNQYFDDSIKLEKQ